MLNSNPRILTGIRDEGTPDFNLGYYDTFDHLITHKKKLRELLLSSCSSSNQVKRKREVVARSLISLDVKSLYTNVPPKEAIDIALRKLCEQDEPHSIARKTMKRLLNIAVSQVHFKCNETCYVQKDGLAMGHLLPLF